PGGVYHLLVEVTGGSGVQESDMENNIWISPFADIRIEPRPNLRILNIVYTGTAPTVGEELSFDVTVMNSGLADVPVGQAFEIHLHLLEEMEFGGGGELFLTAYSETLGIASGETVTYRLTAPVPGGVFPGITYSVGGVVDATDAILESDETDNDLFIELPHLSFSQISLEEALAIAGAAATITTGGPGYLPWFGQEAESFDNVSAAQSARAEDGRSSAFEVEVDLAEPGRVSFYWKVSSERVETPGGIKEDFLAFSLNGAEQARISGEVDWTRRVFNLPAGPSVLRWEYVKDESDSSGADAGWVDAIRFGPAVSEVSLEEALDDEDNSLNYVWVDSPWRTGFDHPWFGQEDRVLADGSSSSSDGIDAAQSAPIAVGETSWLERVFPDGPAIIRFQWKISAEPTDTLVFSISGKEQARISGSEDWSEVEFLIPAGPQLLRWEFVKEAVSQTAEDAAFLDLVSVQDMTAPDLVISSVEFTSDSYVIERDGLPLEVTVRNQGVDLQGVLWDGADLAVHLSRDRTWGNEDDIILGHFAEVETFESTGRVVFSGNLSIPLNVPEGDYYLAILADPFDKVDEWNRENNFYWSAGRDITIRRLPDFEFSSWDYEQRLIYYPESILKFDFKVQNLGLGDVPGGIDTTHRIELLAREIPDEDSLPMSWLDAPVVAVLASVVDDAFLPGVSPHWPKGHPGLEYEAFLDLPTERELREFFDVRNDEFLFDVLQDWEFSLAVTLNSTEVIEETSGTTSIYGIGVFSIYGNDFPAGMVETIHDWAARYDVELGEADSATFENQLAQYAFNRFDVGAGQRSPQYRVETVENDEGEKTEYIYLTFEFVKSATDLVYEVQTSADLAVWDLALYIQPPYVSRNGPGSLSGVGGLLDEPFVVAVADNGYTASVTVRFELTGDRTFVRVKASH
ncbi:MAG TPA: hypothetical protein VK041_01550, partial [Opitutales bacterium]|nr:hypothetical protein [Opitutales bacterium]